MSNVEREASALVPAETGREGILSDLRELEDDCEKKRPQQYGDDSWSAWAADVARRAIAALSSSPVQPEPDPCDACGTETGVTGVTYCAVCAAIRQPDPVTPSSVASGAGAGADCRAETGSMQFGSDWPGVFIRGDNAFGYLQALRVVVDGADFSGIYKVQLRSFLRLLESSDLRLGPTPQMMRPFGDALDSPAPLPDAAPSASAETGTPAVFAALAARASTLEDAAFHFQTCRTCRSDGEFGRVTCVDGKVFGEFLCGIPLPSSAASGQETP